MKVISRAMFGIDMDENFRDAAQALIMLLEYTSATTNSLIDVPLFILTRTNQRLKHAKRVLREFLMGIIQTRRKEGLQDDLLSMLMSRQDEETGAVMTDEQLHDEALITSRTYRSNNLHGRRVSFVRKSPIFLHGRRVKC